MRSIGLCALAKGGKQSLNDEERLSSKARTAVLARRKLSQSPPCHAQIEELDCLFQVGDPLLNKNLSPIVFPISGKVPTISFPTSVHYLQTALDLMPTSHDPIP